MLLRALLPCLLLVMASLSQAMVVKAADVPSVLSRLDLTDATAYVVDENSELTLARVLGEALPWVPAGKVDLNLGYLEKPVWLHTQLRAHELPVQEALLEIGFPLLDHIEIYVFGNGQLQAQYVTGDMQPYNSRPQMHRNYVVALDLRPAQVIDVYLRVESTSSVQVPLTLWGRKKFEAAKEKNLLLDGLAYGFVLAGLAFMLVTARINREPAMLVFLPYPLLLMLYQATLEGYSFRFLWPEHPQVNNLAIPMLMMGGIAAGIAFSRRFLSLEQHLPMIARGAKPAIALMIALLLVVPLVPLRDAMQVSIVSFLLFHVASFYAGVVCWRRNVPGALPHLLTSLAFAAVVAVYVFNRFGLLAYSAYLQTALLAAVLMQVGTLAVIVGNRIAREKSGRIAAITAQLASEHAATLELENRVRERTAELQQANESLAIANHSLQRLSAVDGLTGAFNRRAFDAVLKKAVKRAERQQLPVALMMIDADHFKRLNDTWGHQAGDECLREISRVLRENVTRPEDMVARYGGEEFVVLMPDTPQAAALQLAERMRETIAAMEIKAGQEVLKLTVSIGVAAGIPESPDDGAALLRRADQALYAAKHGGRNCVCAE